MKIAAANAYLVKLPLSKPYTIAYKTISDTEIVFLEIELENGLKGIGASNPFEEVVGETPQDTLRHLQSCFLEELKGRDIRHFQQIIFECRRHFEHLPGTQAAIDIALHDLFCKYLNVPLADFLGKKMESLPTSVTIGIKGMEEMLEEAKGYFALGFRIYKVKTGLDAAQDAERVARLHEAFGQEVTIRVDANQGYSAADLRHFLHNTRHLPLELIEQPLPTGTEQDLLAFSDQERCLFCADESLHDAASALKLAQSPTPFGIFNIKLMKSGGIACAREIAVIAENAGIDLFWGCNDESIVSITAALHAALSCPNTRYLDLDGSFDLSKDLVEGGFILENGWMKPGKGAGLNVF